MKRVILVGAGQLGSRHLQALATVSFELDIAVIDPGEVSRRVAEERWFEVGGHEGVVSFYSNLEDVPERDKRVDIVIIATNANVRLHVIEGVFALFSVVYLVLEKVLFQSIDEYHKAQTLFDLHLPKGVWVNCPRRTYSFYSQIVREGLCHEISDVRVSGGEWGIACNAIHFVDLVSSLTNRGITKIGTDGLDSEVVESKRAGYVEFTGAIDVEFDSGINLKIESFKESMSPIKVVINTKTHRIEVCEFERTLEIFDKLTHKSSTRSIDVPFQSSLTASVVQDLLSAGNCALPVYSESARLHIPLVSAFEDFYKENSTSPLERLPIT